MPVRITPVSILQRLWRPVGSLWDEGSPRGLLSPLSSPERSRSTLTPLAKSDRPLTSRPRWSGRRQDYKTVLLLCCVVTLVYLYWPPYRGGGYHEPKRLAREGPLFDLDGSSTWKSLRRNSDRRYLPDAGAQQTLYDGIPFRAVKDSSHRHVDDGAFVEVDMSAPAKHGHPIFQLIKNARDEWHAKVAGQSRTLRQAVEEYRRRHGGMEPPAGFDKWWRFVTEHDVQLPDEYDQIYRDLYIYRAIRPSDLRKALNKAQDSRDTFTIVVQDGVISTNRTYEERNVQGGTQRQSGQVQLMQEFGIEKWLPNLKAVFGIHDTPTGFISWEYRRELIDLVDAGEYVDQYEAAADADTSRGWLHACPRSSPARQPQPQNDPGRKTFISDHQNTFDLCKYPEPLAMHGAILNRNPQVDAELSPVWTLSKTTLNTDVLAVPVEQWVDVPEELPKWRHRRYTRLMWRGSTTGMHYANKEHWSGWRKSHRVRLVGMVSGEVDGGVDVMPPPTNRGSLANNVRHASRASVNDRYLDVSFFGKPNQCDKEDGACDQLGKEYAFATNKMPRSAELQHKYILDVDGNAWSARTKRLFASGALLFKSTIMPEWWNQRAQPWVHYVPVKVDYSDVYDLMAFFAGDVNGKGGQQHLAEQIANAGLDWSKKHWRRQDMAAYMARLYLEWARLLHDGRSQGKADFVYTGEL